ncbi:hypothetical protein HYW68_01785 [Candidatus Parcubacteria bacterium]|nr:hypothetical protein [Candidatus Parcubacteria bacterium]
MLSGEAYRTVAEVAADSGCWATFVLISHQPIPEQVARLEQVFLAAARKNDDKEAKKYVGFICRALDDGQFVPLLKEERGRRALSDDWRAVEQAGARAQQARAQKMMELYPQLPSHGTGDARELLAEDESRPIKINVPVLLETRRAMLTEVAAWWRLTKDEEEAARLFQFLQSRELRFEPEKKMFREVIYKATDASFPPQRLVEALLALAPNGDLNARAERRLKSRLGRSTGARPDPRDRLGAEQRFEPSCA